VLRLAVDTTGHGGAGGHSTFRGGRPRHLARRSPAGCAEAASSVEERVAVASVAEWVAVTSVGGLGPARILRLLERHGTLDEALALPDDELMREARLIPRQVATLRARLKRVGELEAYVDDLDIDGISIVPIDADGYPPLLRAIDYPPVVLYVIGDPSLLAMRSVAIVGARAASDEGMAFATALGRELSAAGWAVASGLADGIDAAAHTGCLEAGGVPVGVLGCGLAAVEDEAEALAFDVRSAGALTSEQSMSQRPSASTNMARNRIIAGLARATVAVEFGPSGGTLSTVNATLDTGRPLFLAPPAVESTTGKELIRDGARLLRRPDDLADLLAAAESFDPATAQRRDRADDQLRLFE